MNIDVHVHLHSTPQILEDKLDRVLVNQERIMALSDELLAELVEANTVTNELAADVDDLIKQLASGSLTPEQAAAVKAELSTLKEKLKAVAAVHTPGSVAPPAVP